MGPNGIGSQRDGCGQSQGVTGSCGGMVPPELWVACSHGVTHIQRDEVILGYCSCGVTAQGPTFGPQGCPVPSQDELKPLQLTPPPPPPGSFYLKLLPTSSHTPYVSILRHVPVSHLQPKSCLLLDSILLLQPVFPYPPMSLYPSHTPHRAP